MPNSLDPDQDQQNVGPDLGPNCFQMLSLDFCLFDLIDSLRPINNLSVINGWVFVG